MLPENDLLLSRLTVRIQTSNPSNKPLGTGLIYYSPNLGDRVYVLTAAHVLFEDGDNFKKPLNQVDVDFYSTSENDYQTIPATAEHFFSFKEVDRDVAVILFTKKQIEAIVGTLPQITAVNVRQENMNFVLKGFPNATQGVELDSLNPVWKQSMTAQARFQLTIREDYTEWAVGGFSGSGLCFEDHNVLYLYGIFSRFRKEELGRVIYGQYIETVNELLTEHFLPIIRFSFIGTRGLTKSFFTAHVASALSNLGPRFNEEINLRLPIGRLFNDLAKDAVFCRRLRNAFHHWLVKNDNASMFKNLPESLEFVEQHHQLVSEVKDWLTNLSLRPDEKTDVSGILAKIDAMGENIDLKIEKLLEIQRTLAIPKEGVKPDPYAPKPLDNEIRLLRDTDRTNYNLRHALAKLNLDLSNHPVLIIEGEAGSGKSHLFGDVANQRAKAGLPTILLLGQHFKKESDVWNNILKQLNFEGSKMQFLTALNDIGRQISSRVLLLIDALNEGAGKDLWGEELAGFLSDVSKYPFIGLGLSVRNTYKTVIVPEHVRDSSAVTFFTHDGFSGNEYQALKLYCRHYGLSQPKFPLLSPEFTNPLFLQLICEGLRDAGETDFPKGFQGIRQLFGYYLTAVHNKLAKRREEYVLKKSLPESAIKFLAEEAFSINERMLPIEVAVESFELKFPANPNILLDLIQEGVIIKTIVPGIKGKGEEYIHFSYEKFGDFYIAQNLLEPYSDKAEVLKAGEKDGPLGNLLQGDYYHFGVMEALAILLPERFQIEITDLFEWSISKCDHSDHYLRDSLNNWLLGSLKWRKIADIFPEKIQEWVRGKYCTEAPFNHLNRLFELSPVEGHMFNSDRLFMVLSKLPMGKRDAFFQQYLLDFGVPGEYDPFPITRLLEWAWLPDISGGMERETARLVGQALTWLLSSTSRRLRDQATKALVNLLQEQPEALLDILRKFSAVDDGYITERLYAVAYGCILRTTETSAVKLIAQYVYDTIFKNGDPPTHVLLRDYCRNIIEFAIVENAGVKIDVNLVRPPYKSIWPKHFPTKAEIEKYNDQVDANVLDGEKLRIFRQIHFSTMDWDFGNKIVGPRLRDFSAKRSSLDSEYRDFLKSLPFKKRKGVKNYIESYTKLAEVKLHAEKVPVLKPPLRQEMRNNVIRILTEVLESDEVNIEKYLNAEEIAYVDTVLVPYFQSAKPKTDGGPVFDTAQVKRWIVRRAHEMGYDIDIHYEFDRRASSYNNRMHSRIERIGKKYQWIAFYEVFGIVADHYKIRDGWSGRGEKYFQGPWQSYLRNIDPVFTTRRNDPDDDQDEEEILDAAIVLLKNEWWMDVEYDYWNIPAEIWAKNRLDLPDPKNLARRIDPNGVPWLYLGVNINWNEPAALGQDRYQRDKKDIWYFFTSYLVKKSDLKKISKWLSIQNFYGRWLPEPSQLTGIFNREHYWSPASLNESRELTGWKILDGTSYKVMLSTCEAVGEMSEDKSGAHFGYLMPSKTIFEGMQLQYAEHDGDFVNADNRLVVQNINPNGVMVRETEFRAFLEKEGLEVIWCLLGEKTADRKTTGDYLRSSISGVYTLNQEGVSGDFKIDNID